MEKKSFACVHSNMFVNKTCKISITKKIFIWSQNEIYILHVNMWFRI